MCTTLSCPPVTPRNSPLYHVYLTCQLSLFSLSLWRPSSSTFFFLNDPPPPEIYPFPQPAALPIWSTSSGRFGSRPATAPPTSAKSRIGRKFRLPTSPSRSGELVSERTSHACATCCIQAPTKIGRAHV